MITLEEWLGPHGASADATDDVRGNARALLERVNDLLVLAYTQGINLPTPQYMDSITSDANSIVTAMSI